MEGRPVTPVFSNHNVDLSTSGIYHNNFRRNREIPQGNFFWPRPTADFIVRRQPSLLAIDSLQPQPKIDELFYHLPGSPFKLPDTTFIGGDLAFRTFTWEPNKRGFIDQAVFNFWSRYNSGPLDDPNYSTLGAKLLGFPKYALPELALMGGILYGATHIPNLHPLISVAAILGVYTEFTRVTFNRTILNGRVFPNLALYMNPDTFISLRRATRPFQFPVKDLNLRNALLATKIRDTGDLLGEKASPDKPNMALFGITHADAPNIWNDPDAQHKAVAEGVEFAFKTAYELSKQKGVTLDKKQAADLEKGLIRLFGLTSIWRFHTEPKRWVIELLSRQMTQQNFTSPTIEQIVREVGKSF